MTFESRLAPLRSLENRCAVVTGAASGIGRALAEKCASQGMKVVIADIETDALRIAADGLRASGAEVAEVQTDVSNADQIAELARRSEEAFGTPYLVFNNAGVALHKRVWEYSKKDWEWVLGVNLWGVLHGVRTFLPPMMEAGEGHIVNVASMGGLRVIPGNATYHVAKFGVVALSEALSIELAEEGSEVGVSVVCPGAIPSRIREAERNRPLGERSGAAPSYTRRRSAAGEDLSAVDAADLILKQVCERRFWVFTHPELLGAVRIRMASILEGRYPQSP